jgi:hypothetical protein
VVYLVAALPLIVFRLGNYYWFFGDEWEFLASRSLAMDDLLRDHFDHWVTTPLLVYRAMYAVFGIRSYVPYQAVLVGSHLIAAWLLFVVMRRAGVRAWIAACVTTPFVLFGPGWQNLLWAFQIAFTFAFMFGLVQLLLADHEGPINRKDWLALGAGAIGLTCSGVAPAMVFAVAIATFIRRGVRPAAFQAVPLAVLYVTWFVVAGPARTFSQSLRDNASYLWAGVKATMIALANWDVLVAVLVGLLVVGLTLAWRGSSGIARKGRLAAPIALLLGAALFELASGIRRPPFLGIEIAASSRYIYITAALTLPALAVASDEIVARWRVLGPVIACVFLAPVLPNLSLFEGTSTFNTREVLQNRRDLVVAMAYSPYVDQVPEWVEPDPGVYASQEMNVGFLKAARRDGHLPPRPDSIDPRLESQMPIRFGLAHVDQPPTDGSPCVSHSEPLRFEPRIGERFTITTPVNAKVATAVGPASNVTFEPSRGPIEVVLDGLVLDLGPASGRKDFVLCGVGP